MDNNKYVKIPVSVLMDKNICANAKLLYGVIIVLSYIKNYCFADNTYLAETLNTTRRTITRLIKELKDNDYIYIVNDCLLYNKFGINISIYKSLSRQCTANGRKNSRKLS